MLKKFSLLLLVSISLFFVISEIDNYYIKTKIEQNCEELNIPKQIAFKLANIESSFHISNKNYDPFVESSSGALGIMQITLPTAKSISKVKSIKKEDVLYDVDLNIRLGLKYLRQMHNQFGDWHLAILAYNCGPGRMKKAIERNNGVSDIDSLLEYLPKETIKVYQKI